MEGSVADKGTEGGAATVEGGNEPPPAVPEEKRRDPEAPDSIQASIAQAREKLEQGGSILDVKEADAAEEDVAEGLEASAREQPPEPEPGPEEEEGEEELERPELVMDVDDMLPSEALPKGWEYDDNRRLHRKDGTMASLQEHEDLRRQYQEAQGAAEGELEGEEGAEEPEQPPEPSDELVVELPGRQPDETFEIEASDEETAERLRQLANGYQRAQEHKRQKRALEERQDEFRALEREFEADPAAFLTEKVQNAELAENVALRLLADEAVWDRVTSTLRQWEVNPEKKRADLAELEKESYERRDQVSRDQRIRETARKAARQARHHMESLVQAAGLSGPAAEKVLREGMSEIGQAMMEAGRFEITEEEAKQVLEQTGTLDLLGLSANGARGRASSRSGADEGSRSTRRARAVDPDSEEAEKARRAGKDLESRAESRRAAAATPQGAGASAAAQVTPPEGQSVKERIEWAREKGLGTVLSGQ